MSHQASSLDSLPRYILCKDCLLNTSQIGLGLGLLHLIPVVVAVAYIRVHVGNRVFRR